MLDGIYLDSLSLSVTLSLTLILYVLTSRHSQGNTPTLYEGGSQAISLSSCPLARTCTYLQ